MTTIAIDGPAGAGKSTVARALAHELGYRYLDTGGLYRAVALAALERGTDPGDAGALSELVSRLDLSIDGERVCIGERDVTMRLREPEVTRIVSQVSSHPEVRRALLEVQRRAATDGDVVIEGRDIGTTVLPSADLKIFLTASPTIRARRRSRQLGLEDDEDAISAVEASISARDEADSTRAASPLARAEDAITLDTSDMDLQEVVGRIADLVRGISE